MDQILENGGYPKLKLLNFYNNMSGDGGAIAAAKILRNMPQLQNFRYSATRAAALGSQTIAEVLHYYLYL